MNEKTVSKDFPLSKNAAAHRFEADIAGQVAVAEYRIEGKRLIFIHTEVPPALRGEGIAWRLMEFAVKSARDEGFEVAAECAYVARFLDREAK